MEASPRHPPYSPDLLPSVFHLFGLLKDFLHGQCFATDEELKMNEDTVQDHRQGIIPGGISALGGAMGEVRDGKR